MPRSLLKVVACAAWMLLPAAPAGADYGPGGRPASATESQLSDRDSGGPVVSGDGRYVAFATSSPVLLGAPADPAAITGAGAVRKDLLGGAVEQVAPPQLLRGPGGATVPGIAPAQTASISDDGRYVLFQTTAPLTPGDGNLVEDVYVRDMTRAVTDADAYELVSALDGTRRAPTYPTEGSLAGTLSDDGRVAAFYTVAASNLPGAGAAAPPGPATTPPGQVLVRFLDRLQTRLITRDQADRTPAGKPVDRADGPLDSRPDPTPVLAGSGRAVAWLDTNAGPQTRFLPGESSSSATHYLWRDLAAEPAAPARRITGASDPDDPACPPAAVYAPSLTATGPCYGPLASGEVVGTSPSPLELSDDGMSVLLRTRAQPRPFDGGFERPEAVYLADMRSGVSRKRGTRLLLAIPVSGIGSTVLAGAGGHVVFSSRARAFPGLRPLGAFQTSALDTGNVFVVDLEAATVERVTRAFDGGDYRGPLRDPANPGDTIDPAPTGLAVDDAGATIAFAAGDGNLFLGDANNAQDVQVVRRASTPPRSALEVTPPPAERPLAAPLLSPLPPRHPVIGYPTVSRSGVATIRVRVPAAGEVGALARARGIVVASVRRLPRRASTVVLLLRPSRAARKAIRGRRAGLSVVARVHYRPRAGASTSVTRRYTMPPARRDAPARRRPAR